MLHAKAESSSTVAKSRMKDAVAPEEFALIVLGDPAAVIATPVAG